MKLNKKPRTEKDIFNIFNDYIEEFTDVAFVTPNIKYVENLGFQETVKIDEDRLHEALNKGKLKDYLPDLYVEMIDIFDRKDEIVGLACVEYNDLFYYPKRDFIQAIKDTIQSMNFKSAETIEINADFYNVTPLICVEEPNPLSPISLPKYAICKDYVYNLIETDLNENQIMLDYGLQELILKTELPLDEFFKSVEFKKWIWYNDFKEKEELFYV